MSKEKGRERGIADQKRGGSGGLGAGWDHPGDAPSSVDVGVKEAFEKAGVGPEDLDVIECHDASAPAEIMYYEQFGLCGPGGGGNPLLPSPGAVQR